MAKAKVHESVLRSCQVMQKVKELCALGTPPSVILEIIEACYGEMPEHNETVVSTSSSNGPRDIKLGGDLYGKGRE